MKQAIIFLVCALFLCTLAGNVFASDETINCSITWPNATGTMMNLTAAYARFEAEINFSKKDGDNDNVTSVNWSITPAGGSATQIATNGTNINATGGAYNRSVTSISATVASTIYDDTTYTLTLQVYNRSSEIVCTDTQTHMVVDKTKPTVTLQKPLQSTEIEMPYTITVQAFNASQCVFYYATLGTGSFSRSYNMTRSSPTFGAAQQYTWQLDGKYTIEDGQYDFQVICTDTGGSNSTTDINGKIAVYESPSAYRGIIIEEDLAQAESQQKGQNITKFVLVGAGLYGLYWLLSKKK